MVTEESPATAALRRIGEESPQPAAILAVSAHWITPSPTFAAARRPATLHDFRGFPRSLYEFDYPAPGAPDIARRGAELLEAAGMAASLDEERGRDHGVWSPLALIYPMADVPTTQVSLAASLDPSFHYRMGEALAPLAAQGVLILASGGATHNLSAADPTGAGGAPSWAMEFDAWLEETLTTGDIDALLDYRNRAPGLATAHPTEEHLTPLFVAAGAAGGAIMAERLVTAFSWGSLSLATYRLSTPYDHL
jgi:4,5-DOPA dioxygenase extradiol